MAVANTLEQLKREQGANIEQTRSYAVNPDILVEEEGFNVRDYSDPETQEHINQLAEAYKNGAWVPPLIVKTVDGKLLIRDGHCRNRAIQKAREEGTEIRRIDVIEYQGDDVDQITLLLTSNAGKDLKPLERAAVYQKLKNHGLTDDEIAQRVQHTPQHVRQMLALTSLPSDIKKQINEGIIAPTFAMELYQEHGKKAAKIIAKAYKEMMAKVNPNKKGEDAAKMKVTRKHVSKQRRLPPSVLTSLRGTMSSLAPILSQIEIDESQSQVSFSVDKELFMQLKKDAERVKKANDKAEAEAEAMAKEAEEAVAEEQQAQEYEEGQAEVAHNIAPETSEETESPSATTSEEEEAVLAAPQEEESYFHEPAASAVEEDQDEAFALHTESESIEEEQHDGLSSLSRLDSLLHTISPKEEKEFVKNDMVIVRDEDEEALGMHNMPDNY